MEAWSAEVHFPDGTVVRAASLAACDHNAGWRDYGLYLDERWQPAWPAWVVAWPDFGSHPTLTRPRRRSCRPTSAPRRASGSRLAA